mgnify:CR=1 FL=1
MKKLISSIMLALIALVAQAQILTPVKWKIKLDDKGGAPEKSSLPPRRTKVGTCMT